VAKFWRLWRTGYIPSQRAAAVELTTRDLPLESGTGSPRYTPMLSVASASLDLWKPTKSYWPPGMKSIHSTPIGGSKE